MIKKILFIVFSVFVISLLWSINAHFFYCASKWMVTDNFMFCMSALAGLLILVLGDLCVVTGLWRAGEVVLFGLRETYLSDVSDERNTNK
jgi:hypothetical protein